MIVNQPNNTLINHLGKELFWFAPGNTKNIAQTTSSLSIPFIEKSLKTLLKSGVILVHNPFFSKFFYKSQVMLSLPIFINDDTFPKFYRFVTLSQNSLIKIRQSHLTRRFLNFLNITNLRIYKKSSYLLILLYIYLPDIRTYARDKTNKDNNRILYALKNYRKIFMQDIEIKLNVI